ncbi:MAG: cobalamin B12-binding domain-containing protein [Chloroflexi bacterium]|nr:cobalamin B12-binding domain-containing protein [Chloroflexota bacterium]
MEVAIFPALSRIGEGWARGEITVAQEHVAANAIRARLLAEASGWERGPGPRALLACAPGERHELGLIAFGAVLHRRGWRIAYLGQDTPIEDVEVAAQAVEPALVVVFATDSRLLDKVRRKVKRAAASLPLAVAGPGATAAFAHQVGARILTDGPVRAALEIAADRRQPGDAARR